MTVSIGHNSARTSSGTPVHRIDMFIASDGTVEMHIVDNRTGLKKQQFVINNDSVLLGLVTQAGGALAVRSERRLRGQDDEPIRERGHRHGPEGAGPRPRKFVVGEDIPQTEEESNLALRVLRDRAGLPPKGF